MKLRLGMLLVAGFLIAGVSTSADAQERWCDCVTINGGSYTITPGYWTRNGVVKGTTWTGGGSLMGAASSCSYINFAAGSEPNDWHYGTDPTDPTNPNAPNPVPDVFDDGAGNITTISHWADWTFGLDSAVIPIFAGNAPLTEIVQTYDFTGNPVDPNLVLELNGLEVHDGPLSSFVPSNFNLTQVGTRELDNIPIPIPAASDVGLIVLIGMVLVAGVIVVRRGRRMATA